MAEYISREAVVRYLKGYSEKECNSSSPYGMITSSVLNKAERALSEMPSADVQSVKHGYWEEVTDYGGWGDTHYRCSVCGEEWYLEDGKPKDNNMNFCPRCGAKMDAELDEPWQSE